jgi:acyl-homoserine lactone acylase PvdQ
VEIAASVAGDPLDPEASRGVRPHPWAPHPMMAMMIVNSWSALIVLVQLSTFRLYSQRVPDSNADWHMQRPYIRPGLLKSGTVHEASRPK